MVIARSGHHLGRAETSAQSEDHRAASATSWEPLWTVGESTAWS